MPDAGQRDRDPQRAAGPRIRAWAPDRLRGRGRGGARSSPSATSPARKAATIPSTGSSSPRAPTDRASSSSAASPGAFTTSSSCRTARRASAIRSPSRADTRCCPRTPCRPRASLIGTVRLQPQHDSRTATVQVLGTQLAVNVEEDGRFRLEGLGEGSLPAARGHDRGRLHPPVPRGVRAQRQVRHPFRAAAAVLLRRPRGGGVAGDGRERRHHRAALAAPGLPQHPVLLDLPRSRERPGDLPLPGRPGLGHVLRRYRVQPDPEAGAISLPGYRIALARIPGAHPGHVRRGRAHVRVRGGAGQSRPCAT